jgi:hypothetical protein
MKGKESSEVRSRIHLKILEEEEKNRSKEMERRRVEPELRRKD